jgi:hypothetical protein
MSLPLRSVVVLVLLAGLGEELPTCNFKKRLFTGSFWKPCTAAGTGKLSAHMLAPR